MSKPPCTGQGSHFVPSDTCSLFPNRGNLRKAFFQVYELRVSAEISSENTVEVRALSKGGIPVLTWQFVALWLPFFFF